MLTGIAGARADDLQINQQALNTRIDQLAAVGQQPGAGAVFSVDQNPATGAAVTAGSFPRSILIPGTDTSIKIYGQITLITDYFMSGGPANSSPYGSTIGPTGNLEGVPLQGSVAKTRSNGIFQMVPRESKIGFETRTPTPFGEARTVMEFDWNGGGSYVPGGGAPLQVSDSLVPRLRYAYGTLGGLLAGQASSNFSDADANTETIDFGGDVGTPGVVRLPQIRYTMPAWWGSSFSVSAEDPETSVATSAGLVANDAGVSSAAVSPGTNACTTTAVTAAGTTATCSVGAAWTVNPAKATAPDLTAALYFPQRWGHLDFSGVVRPGLDFTDGKYFDKQYIGYGGHFGMDVKPGWLGWVKDDIMLQFEGGDGIGRYVNASLSPSLASNFGGTGLYGNSLTTGAAAGAAGAAAIRATTVNEAGGSLGYQHWWLDNLRSNITGGWAYFDIPAAYVSKSTSLNKELYSAHFNIIWNPVSFVDVGLEYTWGQRTATNNMSATQNVLISEFKFRF
ncbi:MAG: DcaP family trimeric outer membrane transporter [Stellaceae bacterium]